MKKTLKALFAFTPGERTGLLVLLGAVLTALVLVRAAVRRTPPLPTRETVRDSAAVASQAVSDTLVRVDLNRASAEDFVRLGFSPGQAAVIVRYRERRGGFRRPEDLKHCYVVSARKFGEVRDRVYAESRSSLSRAPVPPKDAAPVRLGINRADSAALTAVKGIGPYYAARIVAYRGRLGGYVSLEQLLEIPRMSAENFERIRPQIFLDSIEIQKIDINFADAKTLAEHPYLSESMVRRLLRARELKGGWSRIEELTDEDIWLPGEAAKAAPYVVFRRVEAVLPQQP